MAVRYAYDSYGRLTGQTYEDGSTVTYAYDNTGALATVTDSASGIKTTYYYDLTDRLMKYTRNGDNYAQTVGYVYDRENKLTGRNWTVSGTTYSETYTYNNAEGYLSGYTNGLGESISLNYDSLRRLSSVTGGKYTRTYTYRDISATKTTTQVSQLAYSGVTGAPTYGYTYDVRGNIATYNQNGTAFTYTYDTQNQLLSQTGGGKTYSYTYDAAGNILTASDGTTSHSYTYGDANWGDLLTAYDGQSISYDGAGNPTSYYNGTRWTMNWQKGRQLASATNGTTSVAYTYDSEGLRLTKATGDLVYHYYYADGKLVRIHLYKGSTFWQIFDFFYDQNGHPYALNHKVGGVYTTYYYLTNLQGDVLGMVKADGTTVATYTYDPYGKPLTATGTFAATNPLRYRGYCYDTETGFYYVSSRYYDPEIGRWINADIPETLTADFENFAQYNLFAYCFNNPVNMSDETGTWPSWAKKVVAAVAVVAVVAAVAAVTVATAGAGTAAAVIAVGAAKGAAIGMASGAAIGAATGAVSHRVSTGSWSGAGTAALNGMGDGALSGAVTGAITGAAGSAVKVSQAAKAWDSGTFKSGYQSMKYHYNKHVVSEGLTKGNNVLKYTQDAVRFANRNSSVLKYTYNYNYGNASWNLTYSTGQGGMFTSAGKILTFWYR